MGVGTQVIIIMFDDNQITVAAQRVASINNAAICGRDNCCPLLPAISIPLLPPSEAPKVSITLPSVGQRQVEIGVLVDVLLTVGSVVLAVGTVTGAVTVVAVGLLFGNILLALCSPEDSEYVIVGCDATATVEFCAGLITAPCSAASAWVMAFPPVIGVPEAITHLQGLTNVQRVWCLNIVALSKVTEIVASNPGDIEKCVAFSRYRYCRYNCLSECSHTDGYRRCVRFPSVPAAELLAALAGFAVVE